MNDTKEKQLLKGIQLVENPQLITVQTINRKVVENIPRYDATEIGDESIFNAIVKCEIVGQVEPYGQVIFRDQGGHLHKTNSLTYLLYLMKREGLDRDTANAQFDLIPQLFEV